MLRWIANWATHYNPTPEKLAEKALSELRLELFRAEQRVLDAQMQADYYRSRITFVEDVVKRGIEQVSDQRRNQYEALPGGRPEFKLATAQ